MNESIFEAIQVSADSLKLDLSVEEIASLAESSGFTEETLEGIQLLFGHLVEKQRQNIVDTMLRLSRLPKKQPKTFDGFDFGHLHGRHVDKLKNLQSLSPLYARKNIAFIGPQGVGKTHLAMAFGNECCQHGMRAYFIKASELNQKLSSARLRGNQGKVVNALVKPSCLIIDEIGRCVFDRANTSAFFDIIDRRYEKDGPNTIVFTSNKSPDLWKAYFSDEDDLLCALDRAFDDATVFVFKGSSYRGRRLERIPIETGRHPAKAFE